MMQDKFDGQFVAPSETAGLNRRSVRRDCRTAARAIINDRKIHCPIVNLAPGGAAHEVDTFNSLKTGSRLRVTCREFGELAGFARWGNHLRYGAEFDAGGKTSAAVLEFHESLKAEHPQ